MRLSERRAGIGKLVAPIALVIVVAIGGAYVFFTRNPTSPATTSASTSPNQTVKSAVDQFVSDLNARNVDGLSSFYNQKSLVLWSGNTGGLQGQYAGASNIRLIYATSVGKTTKMDISSSKYVEKVFSPTHINSTYILHMVANSTTVGTINATISVSQEWNWGGAAWQISRENWSYDFFSASLLNAQYGSSTTFPQWGVMRAGGNPNLVSEKSFEWNVGPILAMGIYAFLFSFVLVTAVRSYSKRRG